MLEHEKLNYVEFATADIESTKAFFAKVFGWNFTDYGPDYTSFEQKDAGLDGGFYRADMKADSGQGSALIIFYSADLEMTEQKVKDAGGAIVKPTFSFPGGRRFHFTEPSGNEFAVWSDKGLE